MNIVIINGPNLNLLGEREPKIYGKETLKSIEKKCKEHAKKNKIKVDFFQSNIEGEIVTKIQKSRDKFDGLIINAAAFTHTSVAILDALNLVKTYTAAGTYQIKLVNNFGSCIDSLIKPIVVLANPVVDFIANNLNSCQSPLAVNFSNTSINANTYQWSFGDTNTSTEMNPIHTYSMQGSYAVSLISTNTFGCSNSVTKSQYINIKYPVVTVSQMPKRGCAPLICDFIATVVGGDSVVSYLWDLGDGNTSNIKNPTHTYDQGVYDISLIIVTASGCTDTVTYRKGVKAGSKPHPNFSATPTDACANTPIVFTNLTPASDSADQWLWSFGDGTSSTSQNPQHILIADI